VGADRPRIDGHGVRIQALDLDAHLLQQLQCGAHVLQRRHVFQRQRLIRQDRRAQDRQGRILRARGPDFAGQRDAAFNQ
jgi:hypothetical protein